MIQNLDEWREALRKVDAAIIPLLQRRAQLAIELVVSLHAARDPHNDAARLRILMSLEDATTLFPLQEEAVQRIFRRITVECNRAARELLDEIDRENEQL